MGDARFGGGDLGWRFYDYSLAAIMIVSMMVIAWPYEWLAGLSAGVLFVLFHGSQGPNNAVQREQVMSTLIMAGYAFLFTGVRLRKAHMLLPFGFLFALAASLKPTALPLGLILLAMVAMVFRKKKITTAPYLIYGTIGAVAALVINIFFLYRYHVFSDFLAISQRLIPYYAGIGNAKIPELLQLLLLRKYIFLLVAGVILTYININVPEWASLERRALAIGMAFGIVSYLAQKKLFDHHLYVFIAFIYIWSAIEFGKAFKVKKWLHPIGLSCFMIGFIYQAYILDKQIAKVDLRESGAIALQSDLTKLGGIHLGGQVQCFDMVAACFNALYQLQITPYSNFMGDYMFLGPIGSPPNDYYRTILWKDLHDKPPAIIVLTNMWLCENNSFDKLNQWPALAAYIRNTYTLAVTRSFGGDAYRIYVLNGVRLPAHL